VATWNVNSLRARIPAVELFLDRAAPDVLCLQETRAAQLSEVAMALFDRHGYRLAVVGVDSRNGVAVAARHEISDIVCSGGFGDEHLDREPRLVSCLVYCPTAVRVTSVYVPHGRMVDHWHYHWKLAFLDALAGRAAKWRKNPQRGGVALGPTWVSSHWFSGRAATRKSTTRSLALAVPIQAATGHCFQAMRPLWRNRSMRGWPLG